MSFNPTRKTWDPPADRRALITDHAIADGIGCTVDVSAFTGKPDVTDTIPALYPVVVSATGMATPFAGTAGVPAPLSGFLINGGPVGGGDFGDGYIWHGALDPALLPGDFDVAAVSGAHQFNFAGKA